MDAWPGRGNDLPAPAQEKGKGKAQGAGVEEQWRYPTLEHGTLGAATLQRMGGRHEWAFAADKPSGYKLVPADSPIEIFPPTRSKARIDPHTTTLRRAEQGAHFLRTYYPEVDISADLIRETVAEDEGASAALASRYTSSGNMIDVVSFRAFRKKVASYAVFPMGGTGCQLNLSALAVHSRDRHTTMRPSAEPAFTFETPIQQIEAPSMLDSGKGPIFGVRTMGATSFLQIKHSSGRGRAPLAIEVTPTIVAQRSQTGDRHAMDICVSSTEDVCGYVVNDIGDVYGCRIAAGNSVVTKVYTATDPNRMLYRITTFEDSGNLLHVSDKEAVVLDTRAKKQAYSLYSVPRPSIQLLSTERPGEDRILRLVSTQEVLWFDERNPQKPLLAVKHGRELDTTLRIQTFGLTSSSLTLLTSRLNSLVTVYDVGRSEGDLVRMYGSPYALPPVTLPDGPHLGHAVFQEHSLSGAKRISVLQLSERGSVSVLDLDHLCEDDVYIDPEMVPRRADWAPDIKALEPADATTGDLGPLAGRAHSIVDLQPAYQRIFLSDNDENPSAEADAVFNVLDRMPTFWQELDAPVEYALTTFDVTLRSGPEPFDASRNDWLTGSALDSGAGYRAMGRGRIPRAELAQRAPWHADISHLIRRHVPEFQPAFQDTVKNFAQYNLEDGPEHSAEISRHESRACSQLALDLTLGSDVYLPRRPKPDGSSTFEDDMLSISLSTQAMTLGDMQPPPMQFSFLHPVVSDPYASKEDIPKADTEDPSVIDDPGPKAMMPLGVRLLLQEWESGTDPHEYAYRDPYDDSTATPAPAPRRAAKEPPQNGAPGAKPPPPAPSQRPPPLVTANQPALTRNPLVASRSHDVIGSRPPAVGSQPANTWGAPPSSQDVPVASTQVLPGPHGGRAAPAKKKPAKKRLGGF